MFSYSVEKDIYLLPVAANLKFNSRVKFQILPQKRYMVYKYQIYVIYKRRVFNTFQISNVLQTNTFMSHHYS